VPRIAEGKYLKLAYEVLEENGLLDIDIDEIREKICPICDVKSLCVMEDSVGKLSQLCLDGIVTLCLRKKIR